MNKIILLLAILAVGACGFHLKGHSEYDRLPVKNWQVSGGALQKSLETQLRYASGTVVNNTKTTKPDAVLRVISFGEGKSIYTITRAGKTNQYMLTLRATAQAYRNGKPWGRPLTTTVQKTLPYSGTNVLGHDDGQATLWDEMRQDAAEQIVRQLGFLNHEENLPEPETASDVFWKR